MSTTVTYKGSTLTTVENATKKLTTKGTWLEDDITIQDVSSGGGGSVLVVDTPDEHGGTIREITATNTVTLQAQKQVTLTQNPQTITPDTGYDGFASVVVDAGQIGTVTQNEDGYLVLSPYSGVQGFATGTFTPTSRVATISFDTGLTEIHGIVIVPTEETPLKSNGRALCAYISVPSTFVKSLIAPSNQAGSGSLQWTWFSSTYFTQSGTNVTVTGWNAGNYGYFETVSYTWMAW